MRPKNNQKIEQNKNNVESCFLFTVCNYYGVNPLDNIMLILVLKLFLEYKGYYSKNNLSLNLSKNNTPALRINENS